MQILTRNPIFYIFVTTYSFTTILFLIHKMDFFSQWRFITSPLLFYISFVIITILCIIWIYLQQISLIEKIKTFLLILLLPVLLFFIAIHTWETALHDIFPAAIGFYFVIYGLIFIYQYHKKHNQKRDPLTNAPIKKYRYITGIIVAIAICTHLFFGISNIGKASYVDERLWVYDRIEQYWDNIKELDFKNTRPSDKPGVTTAIMSGPGLLFFDPSDFNEGNQNKQHLERLFTALRIVPFIITSFLIIAIFLLTQKLINTSTALFTTIFISLSPLLLGISRIINPDASLWIFFFICFLSFSLYLKNNTLTFLYITGIFLGLSLLTKYTANIFFIFFFLLIFVDTVLHKNKISNISTHLKDKLIQYGIMVFIALSIFYIFYPGVWVKHDRLLLATIQSEAFASTWIYFALLLALIIIDIFFLDSLFLQKIITFLHKYKKIFINIITSVFIISIIFVIYNVYTQMSLFDFMKMIESPKSIYRETNIFILYISTFYPLIFGITPIVLFSFLFAVIRIFIHKKWKVSYTLVFYSILFILLYYIGSITNNVVPIVRYQIILYPLVIFIASIGLYDFVRIFSHKYIFIIITSIFIFIVGVIQLHNLTNFYFAYNSPLLPKKYIINTKDMGDGNYEIAQYLNSLPNAKNLLIWTDKRGICQFFVGDCNNMIKDPTLETIAQDIDYYIISQNRKHHIIELTKTLSHRPSYNLRLDRLYDPSIQSIHSLYPSNRQSHYIKIIDGNDVTIIDNDL